MNPILRRIEERGRRTPYIGDLIFQKQEAPDPIPFPPFISSGSHYKDCLTTLHRDSSNGWAVSKELLAQDAKGDCFPPEGALNGALDNIYRRFIGFQELWQSKLTPRVLLLTQVGKLATAASRVIDSIIAGFTDTLCKIMDKALDRFVGQLTNFVGGSNCDDIQWELVLKDFSEEVENELRGAEAELEEGLRQIDEALDRTVSEATRNAPVVTVDVIAPFLATALIAAAIAAARIAGTILGGMGPGGAVAAGLLIIIQQLLQGMNLEVFRGKTPDEMAHMLPNYEQLVQATQIAIEKGTDVQTELANLGTTT